MEAENKRIMEFVSQQEHMEETRRAKNREREEAKENLHKMVKNTFFTAHTFICVLTDCSLYLALEITSLCSPLAVWEDRRGEAAA